MTTEKLYKYIGYNGTILSKVLLPDITHLEYVRLTASAGHYLQKGNLRYYSITIPASELDLWSEVKGTIE